MNFSKLNRKQEKWKNKDQGRAQDPSLVLDQGPRQDHGQGHSQGQDQGPGQGQDLEHQIEVLHPLEEDATIAEVDQGNLSVFCTLVRLGLGQCTTQKYGAGFKTLFLLSPSDSQRRYCSLSVHLAG